MLIVSVSVFFSEEFQEEIITFLLYSLKAAIAQVEAVKTGKNREKNCKNFK